MFQCIFEVHPRAETGDAYLNIAKSLAPEVHEMDGFVENLRYRSLTRDGWLLSINEWVDEKSMVRWRTREHHHRAQEKGRIRIFSDYHLRIGQTVADTGLPSQFSITEQRLDPTKSGAAKVVVIINASIGESLLREMPARDVAGMLGVDTAAEGLVEWDLFQALLDPDQAILLCSWRDAADVPAGTMQEHERQTRVRQVRVIRDYGMYDRDEAPTFYPEAVKG